jgi:diguanylate cyclase (GGDEF)-like protein
VQVLAIAIGAFWLFLPLVRIMPRFYTALAVLSIIDLNFAVLWAAYNYGGTSSPFLMWYMLLPMLAFFYLGSSKIAKLAIFGQVVIGLGAFCTAFVLANRTFPSHIPIENMVYAGMLSAFCSTIYAFFMAAYYSQVVDSQSELIKEIGRHETTLAMLTASKEDAERAKMLAEARNAELETAKARLEHNALHDALTGLPNRRYLDEMLASHAASCARHDGGVGLLHIDLDQFKQINDTLGHVAGDAMLVHAARLLKSSIRSEDFVARVGGDEFIVICRLQDDSAELMPLAERIIELIRQPVMYDTHLCRFGACVGIAVESGRQVSPQRLLVNSDIALYRAKARGRNRAEYFSAELQAQIVSTKRLADDILRGLEQREFMAYYQPQFDARTFEVVGVEALVRWNHPTEGVRTPGQFLKVAEDLNAVGALDQMILEQTLADLDRWHDMGLRLSKVSVNVSSKRLNDRELIDSLRRLSFRPGTLSFELVESIFFDETDQVVSTNIEQIRALGIDIEIDDFGTGHASIVSLLKLSPSRLKIDRQFVTHVMESPEQARLVASIIEIGKSLGIGVVAEGVENIDQATLLRELGCDVLQGYAFAKPMTGQELEAFMFARARSHERTRLVAAAASRIGPFYERQASLAG